MYLSKAGSTFVYLFVCMFNRKIPKESKLFVMFGWVEYFYALIFEHLSDSSALKMPCRMCESNDMNIFKILNIV